MNRRKLTGILLALLAFLIVVCARLYVGAPHPVTLETTLNGIPMTFRTDRTLVWAEGDCAEMSWSVEHISGIYSDEFATSGVGSLSRCLSKQYFTPFFRIYFQDGTDQRYSPFALLTVRTHTLLTVFPLLLIAAWCFGLDALLRRLGERFGQRIRPIFSASGKIQPLLVGLFILVNGIVTFNIVTGSALLGYDSEGHTANVAQYAQGRLPTLKESGEYFSPPLPYLLPAVVLRLTNTDLSVAAKIGQLQNIAVSVIATLLLLRLGARLQPENSTPRAVALFLLGMLTVYYKTFSFMRGEPFVVLFTLLLIDHLWSLIECKPTRHDALLIGVYGGLLLLSRQWGALVLIGVAAWWLLLLVRRADLAKRLFVPGLVGALVTLLISGWFYLALAAQTGNALAFNREASSEAKPAGFFTGSGNGALFTYPYSPAYDGQVLPIFYTELWGDYFGYYYLQRPATAARYALNALAYMGLVNAVSFIPTLVLAAGFIFGTVQTVRALLNGLSTQYIRNSLLFLCIAASFAGFVWFLLRYPGSDADTAKATYLMAVFPLLCLLAGQTLAWVEQHSPRLFRGLMVLLVAVAIFNFPIYFTRIN